MKVAFTTSGESLGSPFDGRFGRTPKFLIYDMDSGTIEVIDNEQNLNAAKGAGIQAAEQVMRAGVDCVVTGHCGPKAFRVLSAAGIKVFTAHASTVAEALEQYNSGGLVPAQSADVEGHWS